MGNGFTWYDILEVLPGASPDEIQYAYDSKTSLLRPEMVAGAPSMVLDAAARGQRILDEARRVLGDPGNRERYDAYLRTGGTGLAESAPSDLDRLAPRQDSWRRIIVPDVRGLFYSVCLDFVSRLDIRLKRSGSQSIRCRSTGSSSASRQHRSPRRTGQVS